MIRLTPYRRPQLTAPDGCQAAWSRAQSLAALACHKGDASQSQSNQSLGAQTQGVVVSGSGNNANTGQQIVVSPPADFKNTSGGVTANIYNGLQGADVTAALQTLAAAFQTQTGTSGADEAKKKADEQAAADNNLTGWKITAGVITAGAALYTIFRKTK